MSNQLATLHTEMAKVTAMLSEDRRSPSRRAWMLAALMLGGSCSLVSIGISTGLVGTTTAAEASSYQTMANTDLSRSVQAIQPVISPEHRKGAVWVVDHATKTQVSESESAVRWAKLYDTASASATSSQDSALRLELAGPALLLRGYLTRELADDLAHDGVGRGAFGGGEQAEVPVHNWLLRTQRSSIGDAIVRRS